MNWYGKKNDYQGIVADEKTGETIAITYDKENTELIAAAPDLLEACGVALLELKQLHDYTQKDCLGLKESKAHCPTLVYIEMLKNAIAKAEGGK